MQQRNTLRLIPRRRSPVLGTLSARLRLFLYLMPIAAVIMLVVLPVLELISRALGLL